MINKKILLLLIFISPVTLLWSNGVPSTRAHLEEIHWDSQGNWTLEIFFHNIRSTDDTIIITTSTDTARFRVYTSYSGDYFILTENYLTKPLDIFKSGDAICLFVPDPEFPIYWEQVSDILDYGDYPESTVVAPHGNQSIVDLGSIVRWIGGINYEVIKFIVKDSSPSIGFHRDPARGTFKGRLLDQSLEPIPFLQIEYDRGHGLQQIWTDSSGYFEDSTMYAKDYNFRIGPTGSLIFDTIISIETDSLTYCEFILPINAQNQVEGYCTTNVNNLAGTKIIFTPDHGFRAPDTLITDSSGYFSGLISAGYYYRRYSRPGYQPAYTPITQSLFYEKDYGSVYLYAGNRIEVPGGPVSGTWDCDTALYWVFENIWINEDDTLTIAPGTHVEIMGAFSIDVFGTLLALGTEEDEILITDGNEDQYYWNQIAFQGSSASGSILDYTIIDLNDRGIFMNNSSPVISNSTIDNNQFARISMSENAEPEIKGNFLYDRIYCHDHSSPDVHHNIFYEYYAGISFLDSSTSTLYHNDFINVKTAIRTGSWNGYPHFTYLDIINNIFYGVDFCFSAVGSSSISAKHNLFWDSDLYQFPAYLAGLGEISRLNFNQDSCDKFFNIFLDPAFVNPYSLDFSLNPESPCIDAGALNYPYDPDNTIADIGAIYHDQMGLKIQEPEYRIEITISNYPNPAIDNTIFRISNLKLPGWQKGNITIHDLTGKVLDLLPFENNHGGTIEIRWHIKSTCLIKPGIYLYVCHIDGRTAASNKMILLNE